MHVFDFVSRNRRKTTDVIRVIALYYKNCDDLQFQRHLETSEFS